MNDRPPPTSSPPILRFLRPALQLLAFGVGVGVIIWTVRIALDPKNRPVLNQLRDAPIEYPIALALLCLASILVNGAAFWVQLVPVRRLKLLDVVCVNALASILSYLPFKISVLFRVLIHTRRDRMSILSIGAWFLSVGAMMGVVLLPLAGVSAWRQAVDAVWFLGSALAVAFCVGLMLTIAKALARDRGWAWFRARFDRLPMPGLIRRVLNKPDGPLDRAHESVRMLAHTPAVLAGVALRVVDVAINAARYYIAAKALGVPMSVDQAVIAGSVFFIIGVIAPAGQLGVREGGTAGLLKALIPGVDLDGLLIIGLLLSVTEAFVSIAASVPAWAVLRPDRLLRSNGDKRSTEKRADQSRVD